MKIVISKYGNHSNIIAITEKMEKIGNPTFGFDFTSYEKTVKELNNSKIRKVSQKTDIPARIIKENIVILSYFQAFPTGKKYSQVIPTRPTFTYSKLTIETLEKGVKYVQS